MSERVRVRLIAEQSGGPWIFGRSVAPVDERPQDGDLVDVEDERGQHLGTGYWNGRSDVRVRLLSRGKKSDVRNEREFLLRKLAAADRLRRKTLRLPETTSAWRLCHAEGDDLPGLIVDHLGGALVCEHHSLAFWQRRALIEEVLQELHPGAKVVHRVPKGSIRKRVRATLARSKSKSPASSTWWPLVPVTRPAGSVTNATIA